MLLHFTTYVIRHQKYRNFLTTNVKTNIDGHDVKCENFWELYGIMAAQSDQSSIGALLVA